MQYKKARISDSTTAILSRAVYSGDLVVFSRLIELRVYIASSIQFDEQCNVTARQLIHLLRHLPNVSSFCFDNGCKECFLKDEDDHTLEAMPQSVMSHLKSVKLERFHGSKNELFLVKILLNSARALEKMSIIPSPISKYPKEVLESAKPLLMHPSDSKCVIQFFESNCKVIP
ncbi:hypothetical protein AQUCO_04700102v1 [Aquilegia coerulea]|uniref:FBD domain-containing protein n=1 Tax=Aquilegia coerulea TaxID=218851 RepID=A0A2G5CKZ2_AQUCA|nr:hypothetical protein AQUCO_04700102v1 [Aquilegia coerulea]